MRSFSPLFFIPVAAICTPAYAVEYLTVEQAQKALFSQADHFEEAFLELNEDQRDQIKDLSDVRQRWKTQKMWKAYQGSEFLGWFIVDKVIGKHEFITYATALDPNGGVLSIEIMDYRESYGSEITGAPWRAQFKGIQDPNTIRFNKNIANISGATLSCRNVSNGVKRLLAIYQLFLKQA
ncbi:FMN-binding protein [Thiomicrorhabdus sp. HH1]|uniref:FMN-binding protein n=1 Tax=Thiomicrorhabdus heinhorstiae TaxID=2748010 RepID=A0ABS0BXR7_9GAMM|nr:FMN-binding protein [Thiomicrorhabdus heinhorstiae]